MARGKGLANIVRGVMLPFVGCAGIAYFSGCASNGTWAPGGSQMALGTAAQAAQYGRGATNNPRTAGVTGLVGSSLAMYGAAIASRNQDNGSNAVQNREYNLPLFEVITFEDRDRDGTLSQGDVTTNKDLSGRVYRNTGIIILPNADELGGKPLVVQVSFSGGSVLYTKECLVPRSRARADVFWANLPLFKTTGDPWGHRCADDISRTGREGDGSPIDELKVTIKIAVITGVNTDGQKVGYGVQLPFEELTIMPNTLKP